MKKIFGLITLAILTITLASCGPSNNHIYTEDEEYCCGEICCNGFTPFEDYYVGYNTVEVVEKQVHGHTHKIVTTVFYA